MALSYRLNYLLSILPKRYLGNGMISLTNFSYLSYSSPKILLRTFVSPWIEILNPIYKTKEIENVRPE
jgi:hypothetical protein